MTAQVLPSSEITNPTPIALGGGCHWCTEAVFQAVAGVVRVEQGWVSSCPPHEAWSEAVVVHFDPARVELALLVDVHLQSHASSSSHALRRKYRSAIYAFDDQQAADCEALLAGYRQNVDPALVAQVLPFVAFRQNLPQLQNYYRTRPDAPFCQRYIIPKLADLRARYGDLINRLPGSESAGLLGSERAELPGSVPAPESSPTAPTSPHPNQGFAEAPLQESHHQHEAPLRE